MMSAPAPYPAVHSSAPAPDDHQITNKTPSICVDYLSHNWTDEDVWSSWKAMTKRKNEIANGVRLENASWRTWAKQRGKLKTISPETLNWLKDSDVTWLYGPLHEHADPVPPPRIASARERLGLDEASGRMKSILKHRTISEMLTTPGRNASDNPPMGSNEASREASDAEDDDLTSSAAGSQDGHNARPAGLFSVKSDTHLVGKKRKTGGSPPASVRLLSHPTLERADSIQSEEKRHISFNQRVDQCISIDVVEEADEDDESDEDYSDGGYGRPPNGRQSSDADTASSDEEVLTMKSSPRGASPSWPLTSTHSSRNTSPSVEHHTIAKLAPTMLKTTDVWPSPSPAVVDPTGFVDSWNAASSAAASGSYGYGRDPSDGSAQGSDSATRYSQWDADDDYAGEGEFDYFHGPDVNDGYNGEADASPHLDTEDAAHSLATATAASVSAAARPAHAPQPSSPEKQPTSPNLTKGTAPSAPRSILKKRSGATTAQEEADAAAAAEAEAGGVDYLGTSLASPPNYSTSTEDASPPDTFATRAAAAAAAAAAASSTSPPTGRGRPAQRLGTAASYERIQDAARGTCGTAGVGSTPSSSSRTRSNSNNSVGSPSSSPVDDRSSAYRPQERRDSFRGRAGDGSRAMDNGAPATSGSFAATAAKLSAEGDGSDSDGRGSVDFASPGYPASPQLGEAEAGDAAAGDAKMYGRRAGGDASVWADEQPSRKSKGKSSVAKGADASPERLSVSLANLPSNDPMLSPPSAPGGPTPLNTPTLALARARGRRSGSNESGAVPTSPTVPRRTGAAGALVAPSGADRDAGVRVPLAHDYVEEDEGGIVGRAVEMVNTARDLIGALWGSGDRAASWRQG